MAIFSRSVRKLKKKLFFAFLHGVVSENYKIGKILVFRTEKIFRLEPQQQKTQQQKTDRLILRRFCSELFVCLKI
jgi:hypothetical protein